MKSLPEKTELTEESKSLKLLILFRLFIVLSFFLFHALLHFKDTFDYISALFINNFIFIIIIFSLSFIYAILVKFNKNYIIQAYIQVLTDTALITVLIYNTGGIESFFSFLYIIIIIVSVMMIGRKAGVIIASAASIFYGILLNMHYYGFITPPGRWTSYYIDYKNLNILYLVSVNIAAYYLTAYFTGYLSEQIRKNRIELSSNQKKIYELSNLNKSIIDSISYSLIAIDKSFQITLVNPAAERYFKINGPDVITHEIFEIIPFLKDFKNILESEDSFFDPKIKEISVETNGKLLRYNIVISERHNYNGENEGYIFLIRDITSDYNMRKEMHKLENLAIMGEISASVAHEIKNPLASISGCLQMLQTNLEEDNLNKKLISITLNEVGRLNLMVNDFLVFARTKPAALILFNLNNLINDTLTLISNSSYWPEGIIFEKNLNNIPEIKSDPEQIKQILWNLLINAKDAVQDEGVIYIYTDYYSRDLKSFVRIQIQDSGPGLSDIDIKNIFKPFFTTKKTGMGLGLSTVRKFVENIGGEICASNAENKGASFTILLPADP